MKIRVWLKSTKEWVSWDPLRDLQTVDVTVDCDDKGIAHEEAVRALSLNPADWKVDDTLVLETDTMIYHVDADIFEVCAIPADKFSYSKYYEGEQQLIKPRLEAAGYSNVRFCTGDGDSFGPLTRIVRAYNEADGRTHTWMYG